MPAGAPLVRLDEAVLPLAATLADLGTSPRYRIGPASRDHGDPSFVEVAAPVGTRALRPFAPVRARARRDADGIRLGWIRRTRQDGGDALEVPLGEGSERYEVDILAPGGGVRRTLAATGPALLYPAALEAADGGPFAILACRIVQMSETVGRGLPLAVTLVVA